VQICVADIAVRLAGSNSFGAYYPYSELKKDIKRMLSNAKKFNLSESALYQDAVQLEVRGHPGVHTQSSRRWLWSQAWGRGEELARVFLGGLDDFGPPERTAAQPRPASLMPMFVRSTTVLQRIIRTEITRIATECPEDDSDEEPM
jgi:hypothetical protein